MSESALVGATQVQQAVPLAPESFAHRVVRAGKGSAFTALALASLYLREWNETDSSSAILLRYFGGLASILAVYIVVRLSITGHLKKVMAVVVALAFVSSLSLLAWGFVCASRNLYLHDLVALRASNPRLQRTSLRLPLSRKSLGG